MHVTRGGQIAVLHEKSPLAPQWQKVMMWIFIISDGLLFAGFLAAYGFLRMASPSWPTVSEIFNLKFIAFMTFVLISSSATMATAVGAAQADDRKKVGRFVLLTLLGGLLFLGCQAYEWSHMIHEGARLTHNPWGPPLFTASFFLLTGFHGSHVLSGLVVLAITVIRNHRGLTPAEHIELAGLYWHFIDLVWVFIFTFLYLL